MNTTPPAPPSAQETMGRVRALSDQIVNNRRGKSTLGLALALQKLLRDRKALQAQLPPLRIVGEWPE